MSRKFKAFRLLPRRLYKRFFVLFVLPMFLALQLSSFFFFGLIGENSIRESFNRNSELLIDALLLYQKLEQNQSFTVQELNKNLSLLLRTIKGQVTIFRNMKVLNKTDDYEGKENHKGLVDDLVSKLESFDRIFWLEIFDLQKYATIQVQFGKDVVQVIFSPVVLEHKSWSFIFFVNLLISIGLSLLLFYFLDKELRPIIVLSKSMRKLNINAEKNKEILDGGLFFDRHSVSLEVRRLSNIFMMMAKRITQLIEQKALLHSNVTHDLRNYLTRFRLSIELLEDGELKHSLVSDVFGMHELILAYSNYLKQEQEETESQVAIVEFINGVIGPYKELANKDVEVSYLEDIRAIGEIKIKKNTLKRVVVNVMDNAVKYSIVKVRCTLDLRGDFLFLRFEDDGLGIAPEHYEHVFKPFNILREQLVVNTKAGGDYKAAVLDYDNLDSKTISKLSEISSSGIPGSGLGLSIVNDLVLTLGGNIKLGSSSLGGLRLDIFIPLAD